MDDRRVGRQDRVEGGLALGIGAEVDRPGRRHADEIRPEALEQSSGALVLQDVPYALIDAGRMPGVRRRGRDAEVRQGHDGLAGIPGRQESGERRFICTEIKLR